ncbi:MAG: lipopolysaccharide heptosyltransferase II [Firmicutes bacterium]|nr:lipopolysaccharide heptosyltransferase II [Bacillota bacterium]
MKEPEKDFKKILIIHTHGGIGDVLLSTAVVRALKRNFPDADITVMVKNSTSGIFEGNPDVSNIIGWEERSFREDLETLKRSGFDLSVVLWSTSREAWLTYRAGIPRRIGQDGRLLYSFLYNDKIKVRSEHGDTESHWTKILMDYLAPLGIRNEKIEITFPVSEKDRKVAEELLKTFDVKAEDNLIGLHMGKGMKITEENWPLENFALYADAIIDKYGVKIILTGSNEEAPLVKIIEKKMKNKSVNIAGKTSLKVLGAVISKCKAFVCPDSGPMHIAAALGIPTVAIFPLKEDFPQRWRPYGADFEIVRKEKIACTKKCIKMKCARFECMAEIKVDEVLSALDKLVARNPIKKQ